MRILYIFKHNPLGIGGGSTASLHYFQAIRDIFPDAVFDVVLNKEWCVDNSLFSNCNIFPVLPRNIINKLMGVYSGVMHRAQSVSQKLLMENEYDFCVFDHSCIAGTLINLAQMRSVKTIVIHHNCEKDYYKDNNNICMNFMFLHHVINNERRAYLSSNYNIFLTEEDKLQFERNYGINVGKNIVEYLFQGKDVVKNEPCSPHTPPKTIVLTGTLSSKQNIDGIYFFMKNLYKEIPVGYKIVIAGKAPPKSLVSYLRRFPNVELHINVENMNDIFKSADLYVCPARLGSGIKVRVIDGLSRGLPVIAHYISSRGYKDFIESGFMFSFCNKNEFVWALNKIEKISDMEMFSQKIRLFYEQNHSYKSSLNHLRNFILK